MRGTGFMKCMPMNRSGRSVTDASRVIEIDDVLVASMQSLRKIGQRLDEDLALDLFIFGGGFENEVAIGKGVRIGRRFDPRHGGLLRRLIDLLALDEACPYWHRYARARR